MPATDGYVPAKMLATESSTFASKATAAVVDAVPGALVVKIINRNVGGHETGSPISLVAPDNEEAALGLSR